MAGSSVVEPEADLDQVTEVGNWLDFCYINRLRCVFFLLGNRPSFYGTCHLAIGLSSDHLPMSLLLKLAHFERRFIP